MQIKDPKFTVYWTQIFEGDVSMLIFTSKLLLVNAKSNKGGASSSAGSGLTLI